MSGYTSEATWSETVIERSKVAARTHLSPQLAHDFRAETHADHLVNRLVLDMSTHVMRERLLTDDQSASFSEEVEFYEEPARLLWPIMAVAVAATFAGLALASLAVLFVAAAVALAYVVALSANGPQTHRRTVSGTVTIPVTSYATFPESTTVYPRDMGRVVRVMEPGLPWWQMDR